MSDSSSEEENAERFRAALDPSLSVNYDFNDVIKGDSGQLRAQDKEIVPPEVEEETRESFILFNKLKRSLQFSTQKGERTNGKKPNVELPLGTANQRRRNKNSSSGIDTPSTHSAYLAKRLTTLLDQNVEIASKPEHISDDLEIREQPISLLRNFSLDYSTEIETEVPKKRFKLKKFCYFDSSDEDEVASKCRSLAVTPEWILDGRDDGRWPHPKNIRYLDKYRVKDRRANGSVLAVTFDQTCKPTDRTSEKGRQEAKDSIETKSQIQHLAQKSKADHNRTKKVNDPGFSEVRICQKETSHKAGTNKKSEQTEDKVRKQSRKRGPKRKKKTGNGNIPTNQDDI